MRLMRAASCSGLSTTTIWMVEQFGFAMMPLCLAISPGFTSGTTSGTSGSMRHALELSTTTQPSFAAKGAKCLLVPPPALNSATSTPLNESSRSVSTFSVSPRNVSSCPALRSEANSFRLATG
jgi:hypothetical protein